eukprot:GGOE01054321.1.p3 GENE.GGOE01054321.1~~GGOE01054321.1.p3  ORF type:complete len:119 (+),score=7.04 GGOE01054321.1:863-1219(+)
MSLAWCLAVPYPAPASIPLHSPSIAPPAALSSSFFIAALVSQPEFPPLAGRRVCLGFSPTLSMLCCALEWFSDHPEHWWFAHDQGMYFHICHFYIVPHPLAYTHVLSHFVAAVEDPFE